MLQLCICIPFVAILLVIAIAPLRLPHFWEKNRNKAIVAAVLSLPVLVYLILTSRSELLKSMQDYVSFILLLAALFVISGGIVVTGDLKATPAVNTVFLLIGAVLANFVGTTGASMILIRPLLRTIQERKHTAHIPVFFIFVVSNIGGSLTPLGDPPLFLGYLRGVPFLWPLRLFPMWATAVGLLLVTFFVWDSVRYRTETARDLRKDAGHVEPIRIAGWQNLAFLVGVILIVFLQTPSPFRELGMAVLAAVSLLTTRKDLHAANRFTFGPIIEVAILFAGIFITMVPLLTLLRTRGAALGVTQPWEYFWTTGGLSSFLDNAPTYMTLSSLAQSVSSGGIIVPGIGVRQDLLAAVSCGAVFFGSMTYIGNGPNFMVKSIAEEQGIKIPHFFAYMAYSGSVLLPLFALLTLLFFR